MRARAAAREAAAELARAGIPDPEFEAEYLVRHAAALDRARYFTDPPLEPGALARFRELLDRRLQREPAAYITGRREFYGREFVMTPDALVPRPETELLVEVAKAAVPAPGAGIVAEIGTGSGCVAVTVALERPAARVVATELSAGALRLARHNAARLGASVDFIQGDLATALRRADVVLANLPYIPSAEVRALEPEVHGWEPAVALDGGDDGLALIRRLIDDCAGRLRPPLLALEVGYGQAGAVAEHARSRGATTELVPDLAGIDRVVCCRWA